LNLLRFFYTLRYLKPVQIFGRVFYRCYSPRPRLGPAPALREICGTWQTPSAKPPSLLEPNRFCFLNETRRVETSSDWNRSDWPKLWLYNLHYFDDLNAEGAVFRSEWHAALIEKWVDENPPGTGNGWEPYPTSLRIVNWIKWALAGNDLSVKAVASLAIQARLLKKRIEYHLLGNHLFANAKALIFVGLFFNGEEAGRWLSKGLGILLRQLSEQVLPDGGHFERSPMYHAIILEDLLDLINLFRAYGEEVPVDWEDAYIRMRAWLLALTHPDGKIALFNDAAFNIAPTWEDLDNYSSRLGLARQDYPPRPFTRFPETGYARCENEVAVLLLDIAVIGPDYIPGHAHADTLTFELSLFGQRVIVDSGTSTYEKNEERRRQRGTAAHNTVTINDQDSSEVWGGFRVARRAKPLGLKVESGEGAVKVRCAHDGYRRLPGQPTHHREWSCGNNHLTIKDRIEGAYNKAVGRLHLHPDVEVTIEDNAAEGTIELKAGQQIRWRIKGGKVRIIDTTYHPEFGLNIPNKSLEVTFENQDIETCIIWK